MYFPVGWPRLVDLLIPSNGKVHQICCDRVKIIFAVITDSFLGVWYAKPLAPVAYYLRGSSSLEKYGCNRRLTWKPDSSMIAVTTNLGNVLIYSLDTNGTATKGVFSQLDPPKANLKRDSAELLMQESIPSFTLKQICIISLNVPVTSIVCFSLSQLLVATENCKLIRFSWNGDDIDDINSTINLQAITFTYNQQKNFNTGSPEIKTSTYVETMDYSPLIGGFAVTFNDGRAAFITAPNLKFQPQEVHGLWAPNVEDATCCGVNHKFRLLAFGRKNSEVAVFGIDDNTGGLELCHKLQLSSKDFSGNPGAVNELKWTPDGCAVIISWDKGGFSLWSTFGTMLMCSLVWDYGLHINLLKENPFNIYNMEWLAEGYQLILLKKNQPPSTLSTTTSSNKYPSKMISNILQLDFVKSTLTINPGMASNSHIILQGEDKLYVSQGKSLDEIYFGTTFTFPNNNNTNNQIEINNDSTTINSDSLEILKTNNATNTSSILSENKHWAIIQLPLIYASTNWPIRYTAIDKNGHNLAVAGRTGFAHYSMILKRWKLFGNQTQEKDFIVTAGLLWWRNYIVMGCFSLIDDTYELRIYPKDTKLDNRFGNKIQVKAPVIILSLFKNQLVVFSADGIVNTYQLIERNVENHIIEIQTCYEIDIRSVCIHPACVVSLTISNLKNDMAMKSSFEDIHEDTIILNVSGRLLMIQRNSNSNMIIPSMSTCLASCVECFWLSSSERNHMRDCLWLYSGIHGMRVWLPVLPSEDEIKKPNRHTFMSKRIMLSFPLKLYPLIILFDDAIVLGVENDTILYSTDNNLHFSLPFSILNKKSQVYLHKILRQLIKRNLGYTAWEIARCCSNLPYFPHSLELLLHEVLEEEATSKDPIPDALLPSILEFIREFPVYLQTIVQCARKTEIALWPYLFATAGKPKELFLQSLTLNHLDIAANYLIILQNLEPSNVSRQYATLLFDTALENQKWELAKDLSRFLKAIDPLEVESPRTITINTKISPPVPHQTPHQSNPDDLSFILGSTMARGRSFSTATMIAKHSSRDFLFRTTSQQDDNKLQIQQQQQYQKQQDDQTNADNIAAAVRKKSFQSNKETGGGNDKNIPNETFFIEVIIRRHARKLLETRKLQELGYMSAVLDFHLVGWLSQENNSTAKIDDFVAVINQLHNDLNWPLPENIDITNDVALLHLPDQTNNHKSIASDSGYFSLPADNKDGGNSMITIQSNLPEISEEPKDSMDFSVNSNNSCGSVQVSGGGGNDDFNINKRSATSSKRNSSEFSDLKSSSGGGRNSPSNKLEVQLRYLLQLFTEANCIDFSLILSIILLDAASISRIINFIIRSESLSSCQQIRNALEQITKWSFTEQNGYKKFMINLQSQLTILDEFILKQKLFHEQYFQNTMQQTGNSQNSTLNLRGSSSIGNVIQLKDNERKYLRARSVSESNNNNNNKNLKILNKQLQDLDYNLYNNNNNNDHDEIDCNSSTIIASNTTIHKNQISNNSAIIRKYSNDIEKTDKFIQSDGQRIRDNKNNENSEKFCILM